MTDLRLISISVAIWIGVLLRGISGNWFWLTLICGVFVFRKREWILVFISLMVGGVLLQLRTIPLGEIEQFNHSTALITVEITGDAVERVQSFGQVNQASYRIPARILRIKSADKELALNLPVLLIADSRWKDVIPTEKYAAKGRFTEGFSGIAAVIHIHGQGSLVDRASLLQRAAISIRSGMRIAVAGYSEDVRGLLPGLVLGDTSHQSKSLNADMKVAGLTHLTAVSGANLAILSGVLLVLLKWIQFPRWLTATLILLLLGFFIIIVRPQPSVLRAGAMAVVTLIAYVRGVSRDSGIALAAAVFILLLLDPWQGLTFGFALSVAATAGLIYVVPVLEERMLYKLPKRLAQALAIPIAAQVVCAPLILALSGQLSLVGVPANLLAEPLVPFATITGLLTAIISTFSGTLAHHFSLLAVIPTWCIAQLAHVAAGIPGGSIQWGSSLIAIAIFLLLMVVLIVGWRRNPKAILVAVLVITSVVIFSSREWPIKNWTLVMCNVGQGDGYVMNFEGHVVVIDTGPDPSLIDRCLRDLKINRIDLLVLTHEHADHVEGLQGALKGRQVLKVWRSKLADPKYESTRVDDWLGNIPTERVDQRRIFRLGNATIKVLTSDEIVSDGSPPNNNSIALLIDYHGVRFGLLADLEEAGQNLLMGKVGRVDVLKVAHHGSAKQSSNLIRELHPKVALISVGRNDYGHPAASTLGKLRDVGATILRTDRMGEFAVIADQGAIRVLQRGQRWLG